MLLTALGGCSSILGLDDDKLVAKDSGAQEDGDTAAPTGEVPSDKQCDDFCTTVQAGCSSDGELAAYRLASYCPAVCKHYQLTGIASTATGNNLECRLAQAKKAVALVGDLGEGTSNCRSAGPGGGPNCGSNCESYCQLYGSVCSTYPQADNCVTFCSKLVDDPTLNGSEAFGNMDYASSDNLQCRLAHLSAAAIDASPHCEHATLNPDYGPCNPPVPKCNEYCGVLTKACDGETTKQYDSEADCVKSCEVGMTKSLPLEPGVMKDVDKDTVACRRYHTYNSIISGPDHCNHAGPSGDGHCGKVCPAYCAMAAKVCGKNGFEAAFANEAACLTACGAVVGQTDTKKQLDFKYNTAKGKAGGNNIACRFYHLTKAASDPAASCPAALGGAPCAP